MAKNNRLIAIIINILNFILVAISIAYFFWGEGAGNMDVAGPACLKYFTNLSNILMAIASLILVPFLFRGEVPTWAAVLKYIGTIATTVTLLTVVFFLGPTQGYAKMFAGVCLFLHLLCPLIAIVSLYLPENNKVLPKMTWLLGGLSVFVYGTIYLVMVLVTKTWVDFYGFNMGGFWYISYPAMTAFGIGLSILMFYLLKLRKKNYNKAYK